MAPEFDEQACAGIQPVQAVTWKWVAKMELEYESGINLHGPQELDFEYEGPEDVNNEQFNRDSYELG